MYPVSYTHLTAFALEIADVLNAAKPRPRFGTGYKIPVIFAGNKDAAPFVSDTLSDNFDVRVVDNLRPDFETEVLEPTRQAIRELFISHVMAHAPGYRKLCEWVDSDAVSYTHLDVYKRQGSTGISVGEITMNT